METKVKQAQKQSRRRAVPKLRQEDEMKAKREMSEDEKDRRHVARIERKALAAQMAVECVECGEAGKISNQGVPTLPSAPPLWIVENEWLLQTNPLCSDCVEDGARVALCSEGGTLHQFWEIGDRVICLDCGGDCDDPEIGTASTELIRMRLEGAMVAREAEIGLLVMRMATATLDGPELAATTTHLERLREDRDWTARRLAGESPR
jgi:hypothetical protein